MLNHNIFLQYNDTELQEMMFIHTNKHREVRMTFVGGFPPYNVPGVVYVLLCNVCEWISGKIPAGTDYICERNLTWTQENQTA